MGEFDIIVSNEYYERLTNDKIFDLVTVNNGKVQKFKIGNHLTVINEETSEHFEIEIAGFLYFDTIVDAFDMVGKKYLGFGGNSSVTKIEDKFLTMYKQQDVDKFGLVVINYNRI